MRTDKKNANSLFYRATKEVMIGILEVKSGRKVYASHSGKKLGDAGFQAACSALGLEYAPPVPGAGQIKNRRGELVASNRMQNFDYQRAAPRLIQHAILQGEYPVAMTEIYAGGNYMGQIIPSCGRCANTVPYMLCPE